MTNEEAIKQLVTWVYYMSPEFLPPMQVVEALRLAVDALNDNLHTKPDGQPLTLEELRRMDGKPVWIMESPDWGHWELSEDAEDYLADRDTALYGDTYSAQDCNGGEHQLRRIAYAYPPVHIDREAWEPCEYCNGGRTLYQKTNSTKLIMNTFGMAATLVTECSSCPPHADCCIKDISTNSAFRIKFCPECGRPLTEAAWAELEKRVRGI